MKTRTILLISAALTAMGFAQASDYVDRARVISAEPIVETVYERVEECRYETRQSRRANSGLTGERLLGGIIGGVAGAQVGKGSGRDAAAGVGALIGSEVTDGDNRLTEGELIGGIAGGIIGNQVGKGSGKTAATAAGVLAGAIIGDNLQNANKPQKSSKVRVCDTAERPKKIITGYQVTYEYEGRTGVGVLPYNPGKTVPVNVGVDLIEDRTYSSVAD